MIDRSHGGNIWQYSKSSRCGMLDFSVNINPLGPSKEIRSAILDGIDKVDCYPDPDSKNLKERLARIHGLSSYNFLIGNGSIELIHLIPRALQAKVALIAVPTFSEYEFAAKASNTGCLFVRGDEKNNFKIDMPRVTGLIRKVDLVFLCNPNNPTGSALKRREMLPLVKMCRSCNVTLVIDEAFMDFVDPENNISMLSESVTNKNLLVLRSLTKFFVLPGLRVGYLAGHKDIVDRLSRYVYPWNVNVLAQIAAGEVYKDGEYITRTKSVIAKERVFLYDNLNGIRGLKVYPSDANFFLCRLQNSRIKNAAELIKRLVAQGILVRNCDNFRGLSNKFFRIAVKKREENIKLISALKAILK